MEDMIKMKKMGLLNGTGIEMCKNARDFVFACALEKHNVERAKANAEFEKAKAKYTKSIQQMLNFDGFLDKYTKSIVKNGSEPEYVILKYAYDPAQHKNDFTNLHTDAAREITRAQCIAIQKIIATLGYKYNYSAYYFEYGYYRDDFKIGCEFRKSTK